MIAKTYYMGAATVNYHDSECVDEMGIKRILKNCGERAKNYGFVQEKIREEQEKNEKEKPS